MRYDGLSDLKLCTAWNHFAHCLVSYILSLFDFPNSLSFEHSSPETLCCNERARSWTLRLLFYRHA